jgi:hypothetical protein
MPHHKDTTSGLDGLDALCNKLHGEHRHNGAVLLARGRDVLFEKLSGCRDLEGLLPVKAAYKRPSDIDLAEPELRLGLQTK